MNKTRRAALNRIQDRLSPLKAPLAEVAKLKDTLDNIREDLEAVKEQERDALSNLSDGAQSGEQGQAMESSIDAMDEALAGLDEVLGLLEELDPKEIDAVFEHIEEAKGPA